MEKQALYFGCLGDGHYLHDEGRGHVRDPIVNRAPGFPWKSVAWLDGTLLENRGVPDRPDGRVHVVGGGVDHFWFGFFWWDRTGDTRPGSHSGFYVRGFGVPVAETYDASARIAFEYACAQWPEVVKRQHFPLVLVPAPLSFQATDGPTKPETGGAR